MTEASGFVRKDEDVVEKELSLQEKIRLVTNFKFALQHDKKFNFDLSNERRCSSNVESGE